MINIEKRVLKWTIITLQVIAIGLSFPSQSESKEKATSTSSSTIMYMQSSHGDSW